MAVFPLSLSSMLKGIKAISLVESKRVNLDALEIQFCIEPKKTTRVKGDVPKTAKAPIMLSPPKKKKKKAQQVTSKMTGVIIAPTVHPNLRINCPDMSKEVKNEIIPVMVVIWLM